MRPSGWEDWDFAMEYGEFCEALTRIGIVHASKREFDSVFQKCSVAEVTLRPPAPPAAVGYFLCSASAKIWLALLPRAPTPWACKPPPRHTPPLPAWSARSFSKETHCQVADALAGFLRALHERNKETPAGHGGRDGRRSSSTAEALGTSIL
jgi:hypothetical protein